MIALATERGWRCGVELGLGHGHLFGRWFRHCPSLHVLGVDSGHRMDRRDCVEKILRAYPDRATVRWCSTVAAATGVADGSLDFVFVDAGHSYRAVTQDIAAWRTKIRPGGWFGGHDYTEKFPGVIQAVTEAFGPVTVLAHDVWVAP